jgi:hypothetical protein
VTTLTVTINGRAYGPRQVRDELSMNDFLREYLGMTGTKFGCGAAQCLSCAVIVDNPDGTSQTMPTCVVLATRSGNSHREMAWEGKTLAEICAQIKDPARNGNRSVDALIEHIGEDHLAGWAWAPGYGRQPAPGTQKEAGDLVEAWVHTGAVCPN